MTPKPRTFEVAVCDGPSSLVVRYERLHANGFKQATDLAKRYVLKEGEMIRGIVEVEVETVGR